jgi:cold shock protein
VSGTYTGTVKNVISDRGFLFLNAPEQGAKDIFCLIREFEKAGLREPQKGERYKYQIRSTPKGPQAENLEPVL